MVCVPKRPKPIAPMDPRGLQRRPMQEFNVECVATDDDAGKVCHRRLQCQPFSVGVAMTARSLPQPDVSPGLWTAGGEQVTSSGYAAPDFCAASRFCSISR